MKCTVQAALLLPRPQVRIGTLFNRLAVGVSWSEIILPEENVNIADFEFVSDETGWIIGSNTTDETSFIYRTTDGGMTRVDQKALAKKGGILTSCVTVCGNVVDAVFDCLYYPKFSKIAVSVSRFELHYSPEHFH